MKVVRYTDIDAVFSANPITGDLSVRRDESAIKFAIKSLVLTNMYERPFHKEISSPVRGLLFENFGNNFEIITREAISQLISIYEPRVTLVGVKVRESNDNNKAYISIEFVIKNTLRRAVVDVTLERTR